MAEPIYREEPSSEVTLGPFDSALYYDIEKSKDIQISRGKFLKSVECVAIQKDKLLFIEAKKKAPKELNAKVMIEHLSRMIKQNEWDKYKELLHSLSIMPAYVSDVCEKFLISLCLVLSIADGRIPSDDMCPSMKKAIQDSNIIPVFVLVITWSKPDWAQNVQDAFNMALRKFEKTNRARVLVLTAEQAKSKGLVSQYTPMPDDSQIQNTAEKVETH